MTTSVNGQYLECDGPEDKPDEKCMNRIKNNSWAKTKSGWFEMRSTDKAYCLDHIPGWVAAWRKKKLKEST